MQEARELIAFYDERGWDWTSALAFTLCRRLFGDFRIAKPLEDGYIIIRRKYKTRLEGRTKEAI